MVSIKMTNTIDCTHPGFDTSEYDHVVVGFQRWLHVEDGYYDQARILINEDIVWENHATRSEVGDEHHQDFQWQQQIIHLDHFDEIFPFLGKLNLMLV